ncbi:MAG: ATP-dependent DNA helicase RecG [Gammaproteobacteria bacterium]|nr:ATP-dependent DNA helicase RecG [Gammaproteobacteria bacterium]
MIPLEAMPISALKGVGAKLAATLARLQIASVQDLLFHLPARYQDRTRVMPLKALRPGTDAVIEGEVCAADVVLGRRRSLVVRLRDNSGTVSLRFFHFTAAQKARFIPGSSLRCYGEARRGATGIEFFHPEIETPDETASVTAKVLTPIYPLTEGLSQNRLRGLMLQALALLDGMPEEAADEPGLGEYLPESLLPGALRLPLAQALKYLHQPPVSADMEQLAQGRHPAQQRLALEELLAHHLSLLQLRHSSRAVAAPVLQEKPSLEQAFAARLAFSLTAAQQRVCAEIAADLRQPRPMMRLLQGDVGAGKTLVAARAALVAIGSGYQVAVMAPTEILAEQHRINFCDWLQPLEIGVACVTGNLKGSARREQLERIAAGQAQLIVGTHALFQEGVVFQGLALVIIDEQHRFGVRQRLQLRDKGADEDRHCYHQPHQLIMTATPIPRTLAMSAFADLDCSVLDELPPGRQPISTVVIDSERRAEVIERVQKAVAEGRQAYWVCTLIEESETLQAQAAETTATELTAALVDLRVALVHGRMKAEEKALVMQAFKLGEIDLLVATIVIEVGVDVPNASLMIIENPERLGLAQLHQLRGRVGRGTKASYCVLLYSSPLSASGRARLQALRHHNDGFAIAEEDLRLRGPGEILGTRQTGEIQHRIADLQRDAPLLPKVQKIAASAQLTAAAREAIVRRWLQNNARFANA